MVGGQRELRAGHAKEHGLSPADEARVTLAEIKGLNRRRTACRTAAQRAEIDAEIEAAKRMWWIKTASIFADGHVEMQAAHDRARLGPHQWDKQESK
jgi:hypothetical protein